MGVIANCSKPHAAEVLARLDRKAEEHRLQMLAFDETYAFLPHASPVQSNQPDLELDAMIALGGDGTMLRAVRSLGNLDPPLLGVNIGSLGFMTSVPEHDMERAIDALVSGDYVLSTRSLVECAVERNGKIVENYRALNDMVVGWGSSARVLKLRLAIDGEDVAHYVCDGMIISTPTGSTGHSMSAHGPIVHPESPVLIMNMICPHTLSARPLVLPDSSTLTISMGALAPGKRPLLSVDGQGEFPLETDDQVHVKRSQHVVRFVHLPDYSYYSVLRHKLQWSSAIRP